jgi:hypothetical protein
MHNFRDRTTNVLRNCPSKAKKRVFTFLQCRYQFSRSRNRQVAGKMNTNIRNCEIPKHGSSANFSNGCRSGVSPNHELHLTENIIHLGFPKVVRLLQTFFQYHSHGFSFGFFRAFTQLHFSSGTRCLIFQACKTCIFHGSSL